MSTIAFSGIDRYLNKKMEINTHVQNILFSLSRSKPRFLSNPLFLSLSYPPSLLFSYSLNLSIYTSIQLSIVQDMLLYNDALRVSREQFEDALLFCRTNRSAPKCNGLLTRLEKGYEWLRRMPVERLGI